MTYVAERAGMVGWHGTFRAGERPCGIHPTASVGGPPEHRGWMVGDDMLAPQIASSALIHAFCTVDAGMTYKQTTTVGERSFLQARAHIGHNAVIGADCEICVGVVVCGEVTIGDGVRVGGNSWLKPLLTIGEGAIIGGGSVVTRNVPPHEVWCGNPAKFLKTADTYPEWNAQRGLAGRLKVREQYGMTDAEWEAVGARVVGGAHPYVEAEETWVEARAAAEKRFPETEEVWELLQPWHHRAGLA